MMAIGDQSAKAFRVRKSGTHHAGLAAIQLAHGVEEMREGPHPGSQGFCNLCMACFGMTEANKDALPRQAI